MHLAILRTHLSAASVIYYVSPHIQAHLVELGLRCILGTPMETYLPSYVRCQKYHPLLLIMQVSYVAYLSCL